MQYLRNYHERLSRERTGVVSSDAAAEDGQSSFASGEMLMDTHIMMPLDLLSDDKFLYSIMPFCNGGELFDRLDERQRFSEEECRNHCANG